MDKTKLPDWLNPRIACYVLIVLACGVFYVSQYWSPSSYGLVLKQVGVENVGTILGQPRAIRSDEWGVVTPFTQATVNNDFQRINKTSLYEEDLRINYGLPIFDWGMVFKPTMWGYMLLEPARAYSLHWFSVFALSIVGYALLFTRLGMDEKQSILLSIGLYFTGFFQFWWSEKGPILALFPWVILALLLRIPIMYRLVLFYWLAATWLITNFYPPFFLSFSFVGALLALSFDRSWLAPKRLAALIATAAIAALTVALYLKDYLLNTSRTLYPGHRSVMGGGVPWQEWWSEIFPFSTFDGQFDSLIGQNMSEIGVVGTALLLMVICFLDYKKLAIFIANRSESRRNIEVLATGMALMCLWMLLPLPGWVGTPLLWNHVQPERMVGAAGIILFLVVALLGKNVDLVISLRRLVAYTVVVIAGWLLLKDIGPGMGLRTLYLRSNDLLVLPALFVALSLNCMFRFGVMTALILASTVSGAAALFLFNPIQSSESFFTRPDTAAIRAFEEEAQKRSGVLAVDGMFGATLNGLGFKSVTHVTPTPALDFWRSKYPDMDEQAFLTLFNRYSHISLTPGLEPVLIHADRVGVPSGDF